MRVLFCTDGSPSAREAERVLTETADPTRVEVTVTSVIPTRFAPVGPWPDEFEERWAPYIEQAAVRFADAGFPVRGALLYGSPGSRIVKEAERGRYDLTVVGSGGKNWLGNLLLGSVGRHVLHGAPSSVLVAHRGPERRDGGVIVVGVDGSPDSERAVDDLIALVDPSKCRVVVAAIAALPPPAYLPVPGSEMVPRSAPEENEMRRMSLERAQQDADRATTKLKNAGFEVSTVVEAGRPVEGLLDVADKESADLVSVGAKGLGPVSRVLLGSVSDQVARLAPATLVSRPRRAVSRPSEMHVAEITSPAVTVRADATLKEVAETMLARRLGCLPVVNDEGRLVGIITDSDFAGKQRPYPMSTLLWSHLLGEWMPKEGIEEIYRIARTKTAEEIMTRDPFKALEDETVTDVVHRMVERNLHRLPVVRDWVVVGVVTRHDLLRLMTEVSDGGSVAVRG